MAAEGDKGVVCALWTRESHNVCLLCVRGCYVFVDEFVDESRGCLSRIGGGDDGGVGGGDDGGCDGDGDGGGGGGDGEMSGDS